MEEKPRCFMPIEIKEHRELRQHIREICTRFNDNPDLARLVLVNPILALEDVGVKLSPEAKKHIMDTLRFPARLEERKEELEAELKGELKRLKFHAELPLTPDRRAELLFQVLKLEPAENDTCDLSRLDSYRTRAYSRKHPLVAKLAEYERIRQGGLIFHTRESYEAYKSGRRKHHWVKAVRFKI